MNILYLAHRIPYPPNKGDKLRSFRQLEYLARGHRVWCACFVDDPDDRRYADVLRRLCVDVAAIRLRRPFAAATALWGVLRRQTLTESFYANRAMSKALKHWSRAVGFDVVAAFSSSMAPYALAVPAGRRVLDLCDLDSEKWREYGKRSIGPLRPLYRAEAARLSARERAWLGLFDATIVVSDAEATPLHGAPGSEKLRVVTNGVDLPYPSAANRVRDAGQPSTVGFIGVMDYFPNVDGVCWFVRESWPSIRRAVPEAVFRIVGRHPVRCVRRLASVPGVEVVGEVDDVGSELRRFDVSVAPLRIARGIQNKVLEAMAWGKPVVLTAAAALGIAAQAGEHCLVADAPRPMAGSVVRLLRDDRQRATIAAAARAFVRQRHSWSEALRQFEAVVVGAGDAMSPPHRGARRNDVAIRPRSHGEEPAVAR